MIVGVAIRNENIIISLPRPNRHGGCTQYAYEKLGLNCLELRIGINGGKDQGFITDKGVYLDRWQAKKHVLRCGQEILPQRDGDINKKWGTWLYSEDLW